MRILPRNLLIFLLVLAFGSLTSAASDRFAVTPKAGSLGLGADLSFKVKQGLHLRVMGQQYAHDWSNQVDGVDYDATLDLQSFGAVVDFHPTDGRFRLSTGLLANGNELETVSRLDPTTSYGIGTGTFTGAELGRMDGNVKFARAAPFAGLGWGNPFGRDGRLGFSVDVGLVYQAIDEARLRSSNPSANPAIDQQMEEEERRFRDEVSQLELYPVISLGMSIRF